MLWVVLLLLLDSCFPVPEEHWWKWGEVCCFVALSLTESSEIKLDSNIEKKLEEAFVGCEKKKKLK